MLIILSVFFLVVWLIFFKFNWLPWTRGWKITVYSIAVAIALVVVGALQYYTPVSAKAVVEAHVQQVYPLVTGTVESVRVDNAHLSGQPREYMIAIDSWRGDVEGDFRLTITCDFAVPVDDPSFSTLKSRFGGGDR